MNDPARVRIDYARPETEQNRWSRAAIVAFLIPIIALPATIELVEILNRIMPWRRAQSFAEIVGFIAHLIGLVFALWTLRHIRASGTELRGRTLALIGFAFDVAIIWFLVMSFYIRLF